jgi:hypothetical protein
MSNHFHIILQAPLEAPSEEDAAARYAAFHRGKREIRPGTAICREWTGRLFPCPLQPRNGDLPGVDRTAVSLSPSTPGSQYFLAKPQRSPRGSETVSLRALRLGEKSSLLDSKSHRIQSEPGTSSQPPSQKQRTHPALTDPRCILTQFLFPSLCLRTVTTF